MIFDESKNEASNSSVLTEEIFSLLEERLMVNFTRRKIGEIVVRKEVETHILQVQVPVRHEKLIVEQVSPEYQRLAEIDLDQGNIVDRVITDQIEALKFDQTAQPTVHGEINSLQAAGELLRKLTYLSINDCEVVRIEIVLKDSQQQNSYQELFDRYC
jgi:Domain of unknown function (DUF2382)